ncbi:MAG: CYTH domain-containing protein [Ruminococcaceae bacterium]|nr:CYTH domain-containing protein [Oscillospiraceae bacterium]
MEIEAKFTLAPGMEEKILSSALVTEVARGDGEELSMESTYYRDVAGRLDAEGYTLRYRMENGSGVCCLKWDHATDGAVKTRHELECGAADIRTGIAGLLLVGAPQSFADAVQDAELEVAARVCFTRRTRRLELSGGAWAELAIDVGAFGTEGQEPFYELELEWKFGPKEPYYDFLAALQEAFDLTPQTESKYARAKATLLAERRSTVSANAESDE